MTLRISTLALFLATTAHAEVKLPAIISDHMVLQRDFAAPVWGTATPLSVCHAWSKTAPWANLFNLDGLPAQSFRTDDWK
ncbi:MAG: hypothetical protein JNG86_22825 [Verrucomicrobiaceae bacterium]|nr:hypothetical protein [Verrucomicrobiaceae bacterium]